MKENPFKYGKEVTGEYFCNRKREIEDILKFMRSSTNLIIFSQRRFGKTSLIKESLIRAKRGGIATVYVDLGSVLSEKTFVQTYSRAIAESLSGPIDKLLTFAKELFKKLRPSVTLDEFTKQPKVEFSLDRGEILPYIEDVLSSIQRYQRKLNKKIVVVFDEFQEIGKLENDRLEKLMRSFIQTHQNICYIFSGSKRHLIYEMFNNPNRPFYKSASHYPIGKIKKEEMADFILKRFKDTSKKISDEAVSLVLEICENHPYYAQFLCSILWDLTKGAVDVEDVLEAVDVLMENELLLYEVGDVESINIAELITMRDMESYFLKIIDGLINPATTRETLYSVVDSIVINCSEEVAIDVEIRENIRETISYVLDLIGKRDARIQSISGFQKNINQLMYLPPC